MKSEIKEEYEKLIKMYKYIFTEIEEFIKLIRKQEDKVEDLLPNGQTLK